MLGGEVLFACSRWEGYSSDTRKTQRSATKSTVTINYQPLLIHSFLLSQTSKSGRWSLQHVAVTGESRGSGSSSRVVDDNGSDGGDDDSDNKDVEETIQRRRGPSFFAFLPPLLTTITTSSHNIPSIQSSIITLSDPSVPSIHPSSPSSSTLPSKSCRRLSTLL